MGNCSNGSCGTKNTDDKEVSGCRNNGSCGTSGCNRMNVFDWLSQMDLPSEYVFDVVEIKFKGGRKEFFRNKSHIELHTGDHVVVDAGKGWHVGTVSLQGELVRLQMKKYRVKNNDEMPEILRIAEERDLTKYEQAKNREIGTLYRTREIIKELGLQMKLSDIEYQADNTKATFFYSADSRVDFRELIKILASEFRIRVEMRQISIRQEAGRIGGIGVCGRELCCSTWLTEFKSVSTSAARYQSLSLNPVKLSGQCGRLKCCLNYELETYLDALKDIPKIDENILTSEGEAKLQKTDIFRKLLWFSYDTENNWYGIPAEEVVKMIAQNKKGIILPPLSEEFWRKDYVPKPKEIEKTSEKLSAKSEDGLSANDKAKRKRRRGKKTGGNNLQSNQPENAKNANEQSEAKPENKRENRNVRNLMKDNQMRENTPRPKKENPQAEKQLRENPRKNSEEKTQSENPSKNPNNQTPAPENEQNVQQRKKKRRFFKKRDDKA